MEATVPNVVVVVEQQPPRSVGVLVRLVIVVVKL